MRDCTKVRMHVATNDNQQQKSEAHLAPGLLFSPFYCWCDEFEAKEKSITAQVDMTDGQHYFTQTQWHNETMRGVGKGWSLGPKTAELSLAVQTFPMKAKKEFICSWL